MRNYNPIYYLLFVLLIMGAFASMAQNDYGVKILGFVAASFGLVFTIQFLQQIRYRNKNVLLLVELVSLSALSIILSMRIFYFRFPYVEIVFGLAGMLLVGVYVQRIWSSWKSIHSGSRSLAGIVVLFYASIVLYILSMITVPFMAAIATPFGIAAFALAIAFLGWSIIRKRILVSGERVTGLSYVTRFKDRSVVLLSLFILFTGYMGLTQVGLLPRMYSGEFPQVYYELVKQSESGNEIRVNGKLRHEEFKSRYDRFIERHTRIDQK